MHDSEHFDIIHIDPWKEHQDFEEGLQKTIDYINFIYNINNKIKFEIGTEESIRRFEVSDIKKLLRILEFKLKPDMFDNIEYVVVQSGVGLDLGKQVNTGTFDGGRLYKMIQYCNIYDKKSKEHNGDYLTPNEYSTRFDLGLHSINIAPEFGQLETLPEDNKKELIKICGHYVFSDKTFLDIKPSIDYKIKKVITSKLSELI